MQSSVVHNVCCHVCKASTNQRVSRGFYACRHPSCPQIFCSACLARVGGFPIMNPETWVCGKCKGTCACGSCQKTKDRQSTKRRRNVETRAGGSSGVKLAPITVRLKRSSPSTGYPVTMVTQTPPLPRIHNHTYPLKSPHVIRVVTKEPDDDWTEPDRSGIEHIINDGGLSLDEKTLHLRRFIERRERTLTRLRSLEACVRQEIMAAQAFLSDSLKE